MTAREESLTGRKRVGARLPAQAAPQPDTVLGRIVHGALAPHALDAEVEHSPEAVAIGEPQRALVLGELALQGPLRRSPHPQPTPEA